MEQSPNVINTKPNDSSNNSKPPKARKITISILVISLPVLYVSLLHIPLSALVEDTTFWFLMSNSIIVIVAADSGMFSSSNEISDLYVEFIEHTKARSACLAAEPPPETSTKERPKEPVLAPSQSDVVVDKSIVVGKNSDLMSQKPVYKTAALKTKSLLQPGVEVDKSLVVYEKPLRRSVTKKKDHHTMEEVAHSKLPLQRSVTEKRDRRTLVGSEHSNLPFRQSATERRIYPNLEDNDYSMLSDEELNKRVEEFIRRFNREIRLQLRNE